VGEVERLLRAGANPNVVDADGVPALMTATVFANAEMVDVLLKHGGDANQVGPGGATALMWAVPDVEKVRLLAARGANVNARSETASAFRNMFVNRWLWGAIALSALLQVAVVYWRPLQRLFGSATLDFTDWAICFGVASIVFVAEEVRKLTARGMQAIIHRHADLGPSRMAPGTR
jgi:ankyrin repeat protein